MHPNMVTDYQRARTLRRHATPYEQKLWLALRGEAKKTGLKFRRQHALHPFIVDFVCLKARLAIEIDGYSHDLGSAYDHVREEKIKAMGYKILRFTNEEVFENIEGIVTVIVKQAHELIVSSPHTPTPYPRPQGAGESKLHRDS